MNFCLTNNLQLEVIEKGSFYIYFDLSLYLIWINYCLIINLPLKSFFFFIFFILAVRFFVLFNFFKAWNRFWQFFFLLNFLTKIALFLGSVVTNQYKYLPINFYVVCPYVNKLSKVKYFLFLNGNKIKKKVT